VQNVSPSNLSRSLLDHIKPLANLTTS
jgi:hypothetical protein